MNGEHTRLWPARRKMSIIQNFEQLFAVDRLQKIGIGMHIVGGQREIRTCREIYDASVVAACAQLEAGLNAVGLRHHDVQDEQIEAKILVFVQKREQSSTAAEAMHTAETVGVLPFVILNSELCELKGEAVIITQGNLQTGHTYHTSLLVLFPAQRVSIYSIAYF